MPAQSRVLPQSLTLVAVVYGVAALFGAVAAVADQPAPEPANTPSQASSAALVPPVPAASQTPLLAVSTVKLVGGRSLKKLMGATVYNENDQKIGSIDDLILSSADKPVVAVLQVGGFLGVGGKLVAVSYDHLNIGENEKLVYPGASKETLAALPGVD